MATGMRRSPIARMVNGVHREGRVPSAAGEGRSGMAGRQGGELTAPTGARPGHDRWPAAPGEAPSAAATIAGTVGAARRPPSTGPAAGHRRCRTPSPEPPTGPATPGRPSRPERPTRRPQRPTRRPQRPTRRRTPASWPVRRASWPVRPQHTRPNKPTAPADARNESFKTPAAARSDPRPPAKDHPSDRLRRNQREQGQQQGDTSANRPPLGPAFPEQLGHRPRKQPGTGGRRRAGRPAAVRKGRPQ